MPSGLPAIETSRLSKRFGKTHALDRLDLSVPAGAIYGLIGSNGSGKTTLARILTGSLTHTSGHFRIFGGATDRPRRGMVGYMPQEGALYPDLAVRENLRFFARLYGVKEAKARIQEVLAVVDLEERGRDLVRDLSGGMKRRVSLACALLSDPRLLILDEPTVGVDPILRARLWETLRASAEGGATVLITTHYLDEASRSDRVGLLHAGHKLDEGAPKEILRKTGTDNLEDAFHAILKRREAKERDKGADSEDDDGARGGRIDGRIPPPDAPEVRLIRPGRRPEGRR